MIPRIAFSLLSTVLLLSCSTNPQPVSTPANSPDTTTVAETPDQPLPDTISNQVKVALADRLNVTVEQLAIGRHSRETWSDGCLGLGGAAESCLAALTEGWQIEVIDTQSGKSYFYRTDLSGEQIRLSTLENNLPPSIRDRIFETARSSGLKPSESLGIIDADPQTWNGCYGLAGVNQVCTEIAILGWRAIISDGVQYWIYHTDNSGDTIRLNETASSRGAVPRFIPMVNPRMLGDETVFQSTISHESGEQETLMLENDERLMYIQERNGEVMNRESKTVSQSQIQALLRQLEQSKFPHFDGISYQPPVPDDADAPRVKLTARYGTVEYIESSVEALPTELQAVIQEWDNVVEQMDQAE